jgi:hypothetical protein
LFLITDQKLNVFPYAIAALILILVVVLSFVARRIRIAVVRRGTFVILLVIGAITFGHAILLVTQFLPFEYNLPELNDAVQEYEQGDYIVVEGVVSDYQISADKSHACVVVGKSPICTNMSAGPVGYHRTGATATLEEGMHVKVYYHDPVILRIDLIE